MILPDLVKQVSFMTLHLLNQPLKVMVTPPIIAAESSACMMLVLKFTTIFRLVWVNLRPFTAMLMFPPNVSHIQIMPIPVHTAFGLIIWVTALWVGEMNPITTISYPVVIMAVIIPIRLQVQTPTYIPVLYAMTGASNQYG